MTKRLSVVLEAAYVADIRFEGDTYAFEYIQTGRVAGQQLSVGAFADPGKPNDVLSGIAASLHQPPKPGITDGHGIVSPIVW
jgi:hypothetical protein